MDLLSLIMMWASSCPHFYGQTKIRSHRNTQRIFAEFEMIAQLPGAYPLFECRCHARKWPHITGGVRAGVLGVSSVVDLLLQYRVVKMRSKRRRPQLPARGPRMSGVQNSELVPPAEQVLV